MAKYKSPYAVKAAVYHSNHVASAGDPYRGRLAKGRQHIAENPHEWDGIVFLTEHQRQDFISRFGYTNNLFTISNPRSRLASPPDASIRRQNRGVMLCRLATSKNIPAAVEIIKMVKKSVPNIRLDIYGDGTQREYLQGLIDIGGLGQNVFLRGYASNAVNELETSTFSLLTSKFEGQPLSVMESLGKGCPPVAFDIRYGPQNLIENGHNGYLVSEGDIKAAAQHVVDLCLKPTTATEMRHNAWESSKRFDDQAVLDMWSSTIDLMWEQQEAPISSVQFRVERIDLERQSGVSIQGQVTWTTPAWSTNTPIPAVELQAMPRVSGRPTRKPMEISDSRQEALSVKGTIDEAGLQAIATDDDQQIDFSVIVTCGKIRTIVRLPFGSPIDALRPYPISLTNISLKTVR